MNQTSPSDQTSPTQRATPEQRAAVHQVLADEDTYNRLYRGITLWVFRLTDARTREEAHTQAEEILQEAVVQAFAKLDTYDPARPVVNWLLGFAINIIRQMKRRQGRELNTRRREHTRTHIVRQMRRRQDREAASSLSERTL